MVFAVTDYCDKCASSTMHYNNKCVVCKKREEQMAEASWNSQSTQDKLLDIHRRLKTLERGPIRYG